MNPNRKARLRNLGCLPIFFCGGECVCRFTKVLDGLILFGPSGLNENFEVQGEAKATSMFYLVGLLSKCNWDVLGGGTNRSSAGILSGHDYDLAHDGSPK